MKGMIFAAGLGTRLKPLTDRIPKALLPLAGKTLLQWQVDQLAAAGVTDIVVNIHHLGQQIIDYLKDHDGFGCHIQVSDEREALLETGGGLLKAAPLLGMDEPVLVCNVDILSNIDIKALMAAHKADDLATVVVCDRQTQRYLLFDGEGVLRGWTNRQTGEIRPAGLSKEEVADMVPMAFSGMQIVSPTFFEMLQKAREDFGRDKFSMIDVYLKIVAENTGRVRAYVPYQYRMMDVGKIDQLEQAERFAEQLLT